MAPAPQSPRLADVDPERLRDEVLTQILEHIQRYAIPFTTPGGDPFGIRVPTIDDVRQSTLGFEIRAVGHYAQTGRWLLDGECEDEAQHHSYAWDALTQVVCALYASPGAEVAAPLDVDADPSTEWGVVLLAAVARNRIHEGDTVTTAQLAALAGLSSQRITGLVREDVLRLRDGRITASSARKWLDARATEAARDTPAKRRTRGE